MKTLLHALTYISFAALVGNGTAAAATPSSVPLRQTILLDGTWQLAAGKLDVTPTDFSRTVPVPGLVDLASPAFLQPGPAQGNRPSVVKLPQVDAFWYRRSFNVDGAIPKVAQLKISKAMYGAKVWINGTEIGEHLPAFTPGWFDVQKALKSGSNDILVRIGAGPGIYHGSVVQGIDREKSHYIPGIFDSVQLILCGPAHVENIQVAPDIAHQQARVRVYLDVTRSTPVTVEIREAKSGLLVGSSNTEAYTNEVDFTVPIARCHLWSPEDPFLYTVDARTESDEFSSRFGMREFKFDPVTHLAMLNGKPYHLRGSNFTVYRFFEDPERGALPWNADWVRKLHQRVKEMHWNCLRYSIGFPPEIFYQMADEEGVLIEDEFPIWDGAPGWSMWPKTLTSTEVAGEYAEWMRERWNHPSVVIWDACNETQNNKASEAVAQVRDMDMSARPWDQSYTLPGRPGDMLESHPYHFSNNKARIENIPSAKMGGQASTGQALGNYYIPNNGSYNVIINEYGYLWVNRDGTPTTLTRGLYNNVLGPNATPAQCFHLQALWLAACTEFWRSHRNIAGVMHFSMLGYSRPGGATSDNWKAGGLANLEWEPQFYKYVRDAFAPVGMMMDFWSEKATPGSPVKVPLLLMNDLDATWSGPVTLRIKSGDATLSQSTQNGRIDPFGTSNLIFQMQWPQRPGAYILEAELRGADGQPVHSTREVVVN